MTQTTHMTDKEMWKLFAKTGDIELYSMYRTLKEERESKSAKKK